MSRSLTVAPDNIKRVKLALKRCGFPNQTALATELGIARATVSKFLNGGKVDFGLFVEICKRLGLDWEAIADKEHSSDSDIDIDALVQQAREKIEPFIKNKCSKVKVLKMLNDIKLERIYIDLNFLEEMPGRKEQEIDTLKQNFNPDSRNFGSKQGGISEQLIPGIEAAERYDKLMVWGKPGAGKTTFLKHLAIQCIEKEFQPNLVPIFISLVEFVKRSNFVERSNNVELLVFIKEVFARHRVDEEQVTNLLNQGRLLILFDGFDEVKEEEDTGRVLQVLGDIQYLLNQLYKNRFVLACRLAATEYGFPQFIEVEIADFDNDQIKQFVSNWFQAEGKGTETAAKFLKQLKVDRSIRELATNPLLLTMLCLVFEENAEFPKKRFDLYKEAIDIWLIKWDVSRDIERHKIYRKLELRRKRDLLSYIAYKTFEQGKYFFEKKELEEYITDFIRSLPDAENDPEALLVDSEEVLKAIEAQHGLLVMRARDIYSFSHITIQEYFTAREIINSSDPEATIETWKKLVKHITENRWREVFILVVGALKSAESLLKLMKNQVDALVAENEGLQKLLNWVNQESLRVEISNNKTAIRAFYLDIDIDIDPERQLGYLIDFDCTCRLTYASFLAHALNEGELTPEIVDLARKFDLSRVRDYAIEPSIAITIVRVNAINDLEQEFGFKLKPEMKETLQKLKALPDINSDMESLLDWYNTQGKAWDEQVKDLIFEPHKFSNYYAQFTEAQKELLEQYYNANRLLLECMNIANMSSEVRKEIEDNLFLLQILQQHLNQHHQ